MKALPVTVAVLALTAVFGCGKTEYFQIEMSPAGEELVRRIEYGRKPDEALLPSELPAGIRRVLERSYGASEDSDGTRFEAAFRGALPPDAGGAGHYVAWTTPLGSAHCYTERLRGDPDLWSQIEDVERAADAIAARVLGWLGHELRDVPGVAASLVEADAVLRRDLKNAALYVRSAPADVARREEAGLLRALQYLSEREYFDPADLPEIARAFEDERNGAAQMCAWLRSTILRALEIDEASLAPDALAFLADTDALARSYERWTAEARASGALPATDDEGKPIDDGENELWFLFAHLTGFELFFGGDDRAVVALELRTGVEPFVTDGLWQAEIGRVSWPSANVGWDQVPPSFHYALWAAPDEDAQRARFGRVALSGQELWNYGLWHAGLTPAEAREWSEFVGSLSPGPDLAERVRDFRPASDATEAGEEARPSYLQVGVDLLGNALGEADED